MSEIWKYLVVYLLSGLKFIFGPSLGLSFGMSIPVIAILTTAGMMSTVYLITHFGEEIRALTIRVFGVRKKKKVFTKRNRRFVTIWNKYGVKGIALLTPLLLSPPGGTILANALGGKKNEIITWMWIFGGVFSVVLTLILKYASWLIKDFIILP
ncbi:hypothetical protein [Marinoscillum sp. MHG1-6]|uniref:hypothetical protein n=1 Tax=Marinoscillum sp. MHG1-6 TaxID=2959627 RepID=UPI00215878C3|nr:hypothetical protein [Marinoscillum sp. MHG1-6]